MYFWILCSIVAGYVLYKIISDYFSPIRQIPEPPGHFILGHLPEFIKKQDTISMLTKWCEQFKEYGMFRIRILSGVRWKVVLLKPEYIKAVMTKTDIFTKADVKYLPLLGKALLMSTGEDHRRQRKIFNKAFTLSQMKNFVPVFNKHARILAEIWEGILGNHQERVNVTVRDYFINFAFDALGEICFGYSFNSQKTNLNPFGKAITDQLRGVLDFRARTILEFFPFMWYMPFGPAKVLKESTRICNQVMDEVISARQKLMEEGSLTKTQENDMLAIMLNQKDNYFTHQLVKNTAFTFLFAGHETTATGLPGVLMFLAKFPEMQEKARQEINENITDFENLTMEELNNLTYTEAFIKESMRLFTPAPQTFRLTTKECSVGNYTLPKGTGVLIPAFFIHECTDFERGKEFIPERWLNVDLQRGTFLTFGYGPYACIGKHFAMVEMKVTIAQLLKSFRFTIDPECEEFIRRIAVTIKLIPDLKIRIHKL